MQGCQMRKKWLHDSLEWKLFDSFNRSLACIASEFEAYIIVKGAANLVQHARGHTHCAVLSPVAAGMNKLADVINLTLQYCQKQ